MLHIDIPPGNINKKVSVKEHGNEVSHRIYGFILSFLERFYHDDNFKEVFDRT